MPAALFDPPDPRGAHILVLDDEPANLKLLNLMLGTEGFTNVQLMQDPREFLSSYRTRRPDLLLLDINMPHLDGFAVLAQLKALGDPQAPPVVVLTAQSGEDFLLRAFQGGAADFLSKPFNRRELMVRVQNVLLAHLARRQLQGQNQRLEQVVQQRTQQLRESRLDIVLRLGRAAEFRDNETGAHILRMSHASRLLALRLGWSTEASELLLNAAPMHDVGKIGIPDSILQKPGPLTPEERTVMQTHTSIGAEILSGADDDLLRMARDIALSHHEKWDGTGYPHRLAGTDIPEAARIVAIADVFDALTSARPYKRAWTTADALAFMTANSGTQFEPQMMAAFVDLVPEVEQIRAHFADLPELAPARAA